MEAALPTRTARPASTPAEFSRARSRPTCRWSKRRELSCSSISKGARPHDPSAAAASGISLKDAVVGLPLPRHPGAERYYREMGILR
ncbi:MAG TPA: TAXI family TRAP transporter solute-binding subunit [Stellaceae bacterium]|nr:TAXI family TRAP transporter solute-binding subunit [Stellaceae bacterium]